MRRRGEDMATGGNETKTSKFMPNTTVIKVWFGLTGRTFPITEVEPDHCLARADFAEQINETEICWWDKPTIQAASHHESKGENQTHHPTITWRPKDSRVTDLDLTILDGEPEKDKDETHDEPWHAQQDATLKPVECQDTGAGVYACFTTVCTGQALECDVVVVVHVLK